MPPLPIPLAVLTADIHFSEKAPIARSTEPSWYDAQARIFQQVTDLCNKYQCPLVIAGDLLDKWSPSPSLLNFVMDLLPFPTYAIPGNHDLPHHRLEDIEKSGFWTLVKAGRLQYIDKLLETSELVMHGFPTGREVHPCEPRHELDNRVHLAVVHDFVWIKGHSYPGAPEEKRARKWLYRLKGYDAACFGDNHQGFLCDEDFIDRTGKYDLKSLFNAGTLFRRKLDEKEYQPCVGLLYSDGSIQKVLLDCSQDQFVNAKDLAKLVGSNDKLEEFLEELKQVADTYLDFGDACKQFFKTEQVGEGAKKLILKALENKA